MDYRCAFLSGMQCGGKPVLQGVAPAQTTFPYHCLSGQLLTEKGNICKKQVKDYDSMVAAEQLK